MFAMTKFGMALLVLALAACDNRPPAPTAQQNRQLDDAEAMLNEAAGDETAR